MEDVTRAQEARLLRARDVAGELSISRALAYRLLRTGKIPVVRIGHAVRVKRSDLEEYVERCRSIEAVTGES